MHKVAMHYQLRGAWHVFFFEEDGSTPVKSDKYWKFASELTLRAFLVRCNVPETVLKEFDTNCARWSRGMLRFEISDEQYELIAGG